MWDAPNDQSGCERNSGRPIYIYFELRKTERILHTLTSLPSIGPYAPELHAVNQTF